MLFFILTENEKNTTCTFPNSLKTQPIKTALQSNCSRKAEPEAIPKLCINPSNDTGPSGYNDTDGNLRYSGIFQFWLTYFWWCGF